MQSSRTWINWRGSGGNVPATAWLVRYTALTLTALAILFAGRCALAQATGSIQGKVTDSSGAPILGAVVAIQGADGNAHLTVTDIEGAFQIVSLAPPSSRVNISSTSFSYFSPSNLP